MHGAWLTRARMYQLHPVINVMVELHVVVGTVGGYAKEDPPCAYCVGIFTSADVARKVKMLSGHGATVETIKVDAVPAGLIEQAQAMGMPFDEKVVAASQAKSSGLSVGAPPKTSGRRPQSK